MRTLASGGAPCAGPLAWPVGGQSAGSCRTARRIQGNPREQVLRRSAASARRRAGSGQPSRRGVVRGEHDAPGPVRSCCG